MKRIEVTIEETLARTVTVDAPDDMDESDAYDFIWEKYNECADIILDSGDFVDTKIEARQIPKEYVEGKATYVMDENYKEVKG